VCVCERERERERESMHALIGLMGEVILHRDQVNEDVNIDVMDISHRKQCVVVLDMKIKALWDCGQVN